MWPILILAGLGAGVYYYATRPDTSHGGGGGGGGGGGPADTICKMNGEQFTSALAKLDPATSGLIMAAYNNPLAKRADLINLAASVRNLKAAGFPDADAVADCILVKAGQATN